MVIIIEITEIIEVIEKVIIRIKDHSKRSQKISKECQKKTLHFKAFRTKLEKTRVEIIKEESNIMKFLITHRKYDDSMEEISRWLPEVEAVVVRQTPVSANYLILKQQSICQLVSYLSLYYLSSLEGR